jgi:hypothetical protein
MTQKSQDALGWQIPECAKRVQNLKTFGISLVQPLLPILLLFN